MKKIEKMSPIPGPIQTGHLRETQSNQEPRVRLEAGKIIIPLFVRKEEKTTDVGLVQEFFHYFECPVTYNGQNLEDYDILCRQCYSEIRRYMYGDWTVQNEMMLKSQFTAHQWAVREAFPKATGEIVENINRFDMIVKEFWATINQILEQLGKTREDLPPVPVTSEQMIVWALENGMTAEQVQTVIPTFQNISLNLLHNGRNWDELFTPEAMEK